MLKNAGLVISHRGAAGGCSLARRAEDITVLEVIEALEGPPLALERPEGTEGAAMGGALRELWEEAQSALIRVFSGATIASLVRREQELREESSVMFYV